MKQFKENKPIGYNEVLYEIHNGRPMDMLHNLINFIGEDVAQEFYNQQWTDYDMDTQNIYLTVTQNHKMCNGRNRCYVIRSDKGTGTLFYKTMNRAIVAYLEAFEIDTWLELFVNGKEYDIDADD